LSNIWGTDFCIVALEEALAKHGKPDIFNSMQCSKFTSFAFTDVLRDNRIRIAMNGLEHWLDNVFIERLWHSMKYENVYT
jgi:putative transposase